MNRLKFYCRLYLIIGFLSLSIVLNGQISSNANAVVSTEYAIDPQDSIHVFCGEKGEQSASLTATYLAGDAKSFEWMKYNPLTGVFDFYANDVSNPKTSTINNLANGCYRVKITGPTEEKIYTAWAMNNYLSNSGELPSSDCDKFVLKGTYENAQLTYTDLSNGQAKELNNALVFKWLDGSKVVGRFATVTIYGPPTQDITYTFLITDQFSCTSSTQVFYESIVTKASFDFVYEDQGKYNDPSKPEAPLTVTFTNTSENGDDDKFEWYIYKDLQKIKEEIAAGIFKDSIMEVITSKDAVYTYEETGQYMVKLVSKHFVDNTLTCTDYKYLSDYIIIEESFLDAPNFFTPNGDDENPTFAVHFISMKSIKISIFNRWGKLVHVYENNNIPGFSKTISEAVWDGEIGNQLASPGVYYYVAKGVGRDGKKREKTGFFHLFR